MQNRINKMCGFTLSPEVIKKLEKIAKKTRLSKSVIVSIAIEEKFSKMNKTI